MTPADSLPGVGDTLDLIVDAATVFGLFARCSGGQALVRIPEVSWIASFSSCDQFASAGDRFTAVVLSVAPELRQVSASIRAMYPSPWDEPRRLVVGARFNALVARMVPCADRCDDHPALLLELLPGSYAMLCEPPHTAKVGDRLWVKLDRVIADKDAVEVSVCD